MVWGGHTLKAFLILKASELMFRFLSPDSGVFLVCCLLAIDIKVLDSILCF